MWTLGFSRTSRTTQFRSKFRTSRQIRNYKDCARESHGTMAAVNPQLAELTKRPKDQKLCRGSPEVLQSPVCPEDLQRFSRRCSMVAG